MSTAGWSDPGSLDPYDTDAGADRIEHTLTGPAAVAGGPWSGSVIVAELRIITGAGDRQDEAEQAALHRAWTSEMITALTDPRARHLAALGDRARAVYATPTAVDVQAVYVRAARDNTLTWLINDVLKRRGAVRIEVGIGVDYGELATTSSSVPAAYLGRVITRAEHLAGKAGRQTPASVWYGAGFVAQLHPHKRGVLTEPFPDLEDGGRIYTGNVIDHDPFEWIEDRAHHRRRQN